MVGIEWKDELGIGVASVDADHRALIDLLTKASEAYSEGDIRSSARLLRQFLAHFNRHFEDEQRLLSRFGSDSVAARNTDYRTSHAIFTAHPLEADDVEVIGQLVEYANAWLIDHIIRQDMPLKHFLAGDDPSNVTGRRFRLRFDVIKLRWRIALLAMVPLSALAALVVVSFWEAERSAASMRLMGRMNHLNGQVGDLIHELQRERGLATLLLSDRRLGRDAIELQYRQTDQAAGRFRDAVISVQDDLPDGSARDRLANALFSLDLVSEVRGDLSRGSFDAVETVDFYTTAIEDLAVVVPDVVRTILPSDFSKLTFAQVYLQQAKERAGRERAAGIAILSHATPELAQLSVRDLAAEQNALGAGFMALAPDDLAAAYRTADRIALGPMAWMRNGLEHGDLTRLSAQEWFDVTSRRIDALRAVENQVTARLTAEADALERKTTEHFLLLAAGMAILVLLSVAMVIGLGWSILPPLVRLAESVRRLAGGDRLVSIPGLPSRDELGAFARLVQQLKERLVHSDLLEARRLTANAERLRVVADNMPGVVFRVHQPDIGRPVIACASRKLREVVGLSPADMVDAPIRKVIRRLVKPSDWTGLLHVLQRAGHRPVNFDFQLRDGPLGTGRWLRVVASPSQTEGGWVWDGVALDVTVLKAAEQERGWIQAELARISQSQAAAHLASGIGQEFSAALRPLQAHAERAGRNVAKGTPGHEDVAAILSSVRRIEHLVGRLLAPPADQDQIPRPQGQPSNVIQFKGKRP